VGVEELLSELDEAVRSGVPISGEERHLRTSG
jgi:hypothetical protein